MGHDDHFLQRLDRVEREHVELALGLYRDHELVRFILTNARVAADAERIAIALENDPGSPHVVVARNGHFVTCLGREMSTGNLPVISRAHLDGLVARIERVREGMALAKKRGFDETRLLDRIESEGDCVPREDFIAASAVLGPAVPLLLGVYTSWAKAVFEMHPLLQTSRRSAAPAQKRAEAQLVRGVWAMTHSAMILAHTIARPWVEDWSKGPLLESISPWAALLAQCALPFVTRAAWLAAKFGKPMVSSYKARYLKPPNPVEMREAGWGLVCMALRHASVRSEILHWLRHPPALAPSEKREPWVEETRGFFDQAARLVDEKEDSLRQEALDLGRGHAVILADHLPQGSPHRITRREDVPEDLVLPSLFDIWYDALNGERGADATLISVVAASRARAEDFYFPAPFLHAVRSDGLEGGNMLVEMHHTFLGVPKTRRYAEKPPGRNDPCSCGSGKKFKKCHGR